VRSNAPAGFETLFFDESGLIADRAGTDVSVTVPGPSGIFRVEIRAPGAAQPVWIVSNPVYVRHAERPVELPVRQAVVLTSTLLGAEKRSAWRVEVSETSTARLSWEPAGEGGALVFDYALGDGAPVGQFAAFVVETPGGVFPHDRMTFRARADRPMRISVMARAAVTASEDEAWAQSVYLDTSPREVTLFFDEMAPVGATRTAAPPADRVHSLVFAVELTNAQPGATGEVRMLGAGLEGPAR
jgi:hypothetical protein